MNEELDRLYHKKVELISMDTVEGDRLAEVYDIWNFPAVVAVDSSGAPQKVWSDGQLPLLSEVNYYIQS